MLNLHPQTMLVEIAPLWPVLKQHQAENKPLVLATIAETTGASYKKKGAMMLIEPNKTTHGLLSGGCLETDVAEHAMTVFADAKPKSLTYDLSDDSVFGLGAGCDGQIQIVLQLLQGDYLPLSALNPESGQAQSTTLFLSSADESLGQFAICQSGAWTESTSGIREHFKPTAALHYEPSPKVMIVGAGTDAIPLAKGLNTLFWHGHIIDHRPGLLTNERFPKPLKLHRSELDDLPANLERIKPDAVVLMTHNLDRDAGALTAAIANQIPYIGLLGPQSRRDKVLKLAAVSLGDLAGQLHAPVGLKLGGRLPENIALSVLAELQAHFFGSK